MNLLQKQQMSFDFIKNFKSLGNSILSLFKMKMPGDDNDEDGDDNIQIEVTNGEESLPGIKE